MTPLQFGKQECANYTPSGGCQGIGIHNDGSLYGFGHKPKCLLATGQRCQYFEECVFPMRLEANTARNKVRSEEIEQAKWQYRQMTGFLAKKRLGSQRNGQETPALAAGSPASDNFEGGRSPSPTDLENT